MRGGREATFAYRKLGSRPSPATAVSRDRGTIMLLTAISTMPMVYMMLLASPVRNEGPEGGEVESHDVADVLVVGGCINGAGIARDAADRSFGVTLVEQDDLASYTSSPSTKLIHGGLHCLDYYEFRLVREALVERERLLRCAPYIVRRKRFVLPFTAGPRPAWMLRLGLFIYDRRSGRQTLARSEEVRLPHPFGVALRPGIRGVFAYSDCWVEDSRLVVLNARDAVEHGVRIHARIRRLSAERYGGLWHATVERVASGERQELHARTLVNAAGPWVSEVLTGRPHVNSRKHVCLVKDSVNRWVVRPVAPTDVVWSYASVRPLYDDAASNASAVTREYVLDVDTAQGQALLWSVFSGKITTFRRLAEHTLEKLAPHLPRPAVPSGADGAAARTCLRNPDRPPARRGQETRRSRCGSWRRPDRGRDRLPRARGVGRGAGRHPVAPLEARPACAGGHRDTVCDPTRPRSCQGDPSGWMAKVDGED